MAMSPKPIASFTAHEGGMTSASFLPNGTILATGGYDCTVRLWNTVTWREERVLPGHRRGHVAFSPDGSQLVSAGLHKPAVLFETNTWQPITTLLGTSSAWAAEFAPDGAKLILVHPPEDLSADAARPVEVWDAERWRIETTVDVGSALVYAVSFSQDSKLAAVATVPGNNVTLWNADFSQKLRSFVPHDSATFGLGFSSDGRFLATGGSDATARLWEVSSLILLCELTHETIIRSGYPNGVLCATYSPDDALIVTGSLDGKITIWRM